jgi:sugar phosphate permease
MADSLPSGVVRYQVLGGFAFLASITYLDRVCMSQAAVPISQALGLDKRQMGFVFSAFTMAYTLFEIPTGWLGDRIGPRRVLVRIVLWWSVFTALTGSASGLATMLLIRFAFGAGEAGAFPNIARALTRWFPTSQRGTVQGAIWTSARIGGAIAPPLTALVMNRIGWRATFALYGLVGLVWAGVFWAWYRDEPAEHPSISPGELAWIKGWQSAQAGQTHKPAPWPRILRNPSVWGLAGCTCFVSFAWFFNASWLPTYLKEARGLDLDRASWFASLPFIFGLVGCAIGGWASDRLTTVVGARWSRRLVGFTGSMLAGMCFLLSLRVLNVVEAMMLIALSAFFNDLTVGSLWAAIMDVGERDSGRVAGVVNTASGLGGFLSPLVFGEMVNRGTGWAPALFVAGVAFLVGGLFWLLVDPTRTVARPRADAELAELT